MYYFFRSKIVYWNNEPISAKFTSNNLGKLAEEWWYGKPLQPTSIAFEFAIPGDAPVIDNYFPGLLLDIYSEKIIDLFSRYKINFELFPAKFFDIKNGKALKMNHSVFRLLDISDCLDEDKIEFSYPSFIDPPQKAFFKPVFTNEFLRSGKLLTRIKGYEKFILIHEKLKKEIEDNQLSGCEFSVERTNYNKFITK